jgi:hypothetical protein
MRQIFRELHIRLLARLMANNREDAIAAYSLTVQGRHELRQSEVGSSTQGANEIRTRSCLDLRSFMRGNHSYDDAMNVAFEMAGNSDSIFVPQDVPTQPPPPSMTASEAHAPEAGEGEEQPTAQSYRQHLIRFLEMPEDTRMGFDPFSGIYEAARARILELAGRLGLDAEQMGILFDHWLLRSAEETPFVLDQAAHESVNCLWRIAHRYQMWAPFADLALRLISCGVSEADAERLLSLQRNIAGLHGTRFGIATMEARLRSRTATSTGREKRVRNEGRTGGPIEDFEIRPLVEGVDEQEADESDRESSDSHVDDDSDDD